MLGIPVVHFGKFSEGTNGYILIADTDNLFLETVSSVIFQDEIDESLTTIVETPTSLEILNTYLNSTDTVPDGAWHKTSSLLYVFLNSTTFPYEVNTLFTPIGTRTGIPIQSLSDQTIDVPEKHLELFLKYVIKESAQLLGKQVPPSILQDIEELESKI